MNGWEREAKKKIRAFNETKAACEQHHVLIIWFNSMAIKVDRCCCCDLRFYYYFGSFALCVSLSLFFSRFFFIKCEMAFFFSPFQPDFCKSLLFVLYTVHTHTPRTPFQTLCFSSIVNITYSCNEKTHRTEQKKKKTATTK